MTKTASSAAAKTEKKETGLDQRLAEELRANLARRKKQQRGRSKAKTPEGG